MDEIIYLESDEEITSVIDKIKNAKSASVGLVVPRNATLFQSVVNLRLIAKEAKIFIKDISIVTTDKIGLNLAAQVGLQVYNSIKEERPVFVPSTSSAPDQDEIIEIKPVEVHKEPIERNIQSGRVKVHHFQEDRPIIRWQNGQKPVMQKENKPASQAVSSQNREIERKLNRKVKKIIGPIIVVLLILAGLASYFLLPSSSIQVYVKSETLDKNLPVVFATSVVEPDAAQNFFPGILVEASQEQAKKFQTTGKKNLGGKASGTVTFYNGLDSLSHKYPAETKIIASNKTYLTKIAITVPGATVQNLKVVPGSVTVEIEAENAGEDYNVSATKLVITGIPVNQQEAIYAETKASLKGGFSKVVPVVSKEDYENAQKSVTDGLLELIDEDLKTKSSGMTIIDKSEAMLEPVVVSSSKIDQEATEFEMKVKLTKQVMAYDYEKLSSFIISSLEKQVPAGKMVAIPSGDAVSFVINKQAYDKGELDSTLNISAKVAAKIDTNQIKNGVIGKSKSAAEGYITSQPGVEKVAINFKPAWLKKISDLSRNITVEIKYITQE